MSQTPTSLCAKNLRSIHRALSAYRIAVGRLPSFLSELYPKYLRDTRALLCPCDAASGHPGMEPVDPALPCSYLYEMSDTPTRGVGVQLGEEPLTPPVSWHLCKMAQRPYFVGRVPAVSCNHHGAHIIALSLEGRVFRIDRMWERDPAAITTVLTLLEADLGDRPAPSCRRWSLAALNDYMMSWQDDALPPEIRGRIGRIADQLLRLAQGLSAAQREQALVLALRCYAASGRLQSARSIIDERPGDDVPRRPRQALASGLRYRVGEIRTPPVQEYLCSERERLQIPGLCAAVVVHGQLCFLRGDGWADYGRNLPATPDTGYQIASLSKPFTAIAVMKLVEEGLIALDDPLGSYMSSLPGPWARATVRQLLTHTAGLRNFASVPNFTQIAGTAYSRRDLLRLLSEAPVEFAPGRRWSYSNTGYFALSVLVEEVAAQPFDVFMQGRLWNPLGMVRTSAGIKPDSGTDRAVGYTWAEEGNVPWRAVRAYATDGLISTAADLALWASALQAGRILDAKSVEAMWTCATLADGTPTRYGLGWFVEKCRGRRVVSHLGAMPGISTSLLHYPDEQVSTIVLANCDGVDARELIDLSFKPRSYEVVSVVFQ